MKVLYIGHYKENSGWANAAVNQILALDKVGVDVVCRNVTLTQDNNNIDPRIRQLEQKDSYGCDICIQHVLPHHLIGGDSFKRNIAFLESESTSLKNVGWLTQLEQMQEIWVPNNDLRESLISDGIKAPIRVVHHPSEISKYQRKYQEIQIDPAKNKFKFYYIGDLNERKNLESIITCFHSEFDRSEPVSLILKVRKFGHSTEQTKELTDQIITKVKQSLRMYPDIRQYHMDIVVSEDVTQDQLYSLHQHCDCFISPTHGEAWSLPSFDAMGFGSSPICSNYGGPKEFIGEGCGTLVGGSYSVCKCSDAAFPDIFTGREYWFQPCEMQIRKAMREKYETYQKDPLGTKRTWKLAGLEQVKLFSYEKIGEEMKGLLSE
jgi:glycosyltransferase involved in cell wall biosynthesis